MYTPYTDPAAMLLYTNEIWALDCKQPTINSSIEFLRIASCYSNSNSVVYLCIEILLNFLVKLGKVHRSKDRSGCFTIQR